MHLLRIYLVFVWITLDRTAQGLWGLITLFFDVKRSLNPSQSHLCIRLKLHCKKHRELEWARTDPVHGGKVGTSPGLGWLTWLIRKFLSLLGSLICQDPLLTHDLHIGDLQRVHMLASPLLPSLLLRSLPVYHLYDGPGHWRLLGLYLKTQIRNSSFLLLYKRRLFRLALFWWVRARTGAV